MPFSDCVQHSAFIEVAQSEQIAYAVEAGGVYDRGLIFVYLVIVSGDDALKFVSFFVCFNNLAWRPAQALFVVVLNPKQFFWRIMATWNSLSHCGTVLDF